MSPPTVLVVDDSAAMRRMLTRTLVLAGLSEDQIRTAKDGIDALEQLERERPTLMITDITMPRMDGVELLKTIRERNWPEPMTTIACTSVSSSRTLLELVRLGCDQVIRKPFDRTELALQLGELLAPVEQPEPAPEPQGPSPLTALDRAVHRVLETMAFAIPEPATPEQTARDLERSLHCKARIPLSGATTGALEIWATPYTSYRLALGLLGEVERGDDRTCLEALAEIANILAGDWLTTLKDDGVEEAGAIELQPPEVSVHLPLEVPDNGEVLSEIRTYALEDGALLHVRIEERPPEVHTTPATPGGEP